LRRPTRPGLNIYTATIGGAFIVSDKIANIRISPYIEYKTVDGAAGGPSGGICDVRPGAEQKARPRGCNTPSDPALWRVDNVLGRNFISDALAGDRNYEY